MGGSLWESKVTEVENDAVYDGKSKALYMESCFEYWFQAVFIF